MLQLNHAQAVTERVFWREADAGEVATQPCPSGNCDARCKTSQTAPLQLNHAQAVTLVVCGATGSVAALQLNHAQAVTVNMSTLRCGVAMLQLNHAQAVTVIGTAFAGFSYRVATQPCPSGN